jgi:hypothetical protein
MTVSNLQKMRIKKAANTWHLIADDFGQLWFLKLHVSHQL